ncbi:MAG: hypothetical protein ACRDEB_02130 [Chitinophagaceae bacterium]
MTIKEEKKPKKTGYNCISLGISVPAGDFSSTHFAGLTVEYSPASQIIYRKGKKQNFIYTYNGGLKYYFGKKETPGGYLYKYPGYFILYAFGGIRFLPTSKFDMSLTTGPALVFYNGTTRFNIGGILGGRYHINNRFSVSPFIIALKEKNADPLWAFGIKAGYDF